MAPAPAPVGCCTGVFWQDLCIHFPCLQEAVFRGGRDLPKIVNLKQANSQLCKLLGQSNSIRSAKDLKLPVWKTPKFQENSCPGGRCTF